MRSKPSGVTDKDRAALITSIELRGRTLTAWLLLEYRT
jgi:hypothetical protein